MLSLPSVFLAPRSPYPIASFPLYFKQNHTAQLLLPFPHSKMEGENLTPSGQKLRGAGFEELQSALSSNDSCHPG